MLNTVEDIDTEDEDDTHTESLIETRRMRKFFRIGGKILLILGIVTVIIGLTGGIALVPIILGGYLITCGVVNLVVKV